MILLFGIAAVIALGALVAVVVAVGPGERGRRARTVEFAFKPKALRCRCCAAEMPLGMPGDLCATCLRTWDANRLRRHELHASSSTQWFVGRKGRRLGSYRFAALQQLAERGKLRPNDLVWTEGMAGWQRADAIEGLLLPTTAESLPIAVREVATRTVVRAKPARAALVPTARSVRASYLLRHWRGDLSLPVSYWVNWLPITLLLTTVVVGTAAPSLVARLGARGNGLWLLAVLACALIIAIWQAVGLWRSADQYVSRGGKSGWATVAKICVVLGLLRLAGLGVEQIPTAQQSLGLASRGHSMRALELHVLNHGTDVEIAGGMSLGTTDALRIILDATPTIGVVQLNNAGGWISEGNRVGKLIEARALSTFTARECDSACLLAFLRGRERYLGSRGRLGFHEAPAAGVGGDPAQKGNELFRQAFLAKGVPTSFIDRALATPATDVWYPTTQELLQAHVISAVVDERESAMIGFNAARAKLEADLVAVPVFAVLRRLEPDTFQSLKETYVSGVLAGTPQNEMSAKMHATIMEKVIPRYVRIAPDDELVAYWQTQLQKARELRAIDPRYCVQFLAPQPGTDTSKLSRLFSAEVQAADIRALADLMSAGAEHPRSVPAGAAVQGALRESARRAERLMPGAVRIVANPGTAATNPGEFCSAEVTFYESILALPTDRAGPLLRFLVAQG